MSTGSVPLRDIANGKYDTSIRTWMQQVAAYGHPFFLILDVEMNGTWEPYSPGVNDNTSADFVNMWRHVHDLAQQAGAANITWVWAPNVDPRGLFTPYDQVFPGTAYVDGPASTASTWTDSPAPTGSSGRATTPSCSWRRRSRS
jgi:beta-mannanase